MSKSHSIYIFGPLLVGLPSALLALMLALPAQPVRAHDDADVRVATASGLANLRAVPAGGRSAVDLGRSPKRVLTLDLTREPNDIWDRIRRGFRMPDLSSKRVLELQFSYLDRPEYLDRLFNRGARYLYYIVGEIERRGLPTELALLPMVESSFNPHAYSRARASGLWQFIPSTGHNYKLVQNRWVDERRDVIASTNAALDYLEDIYDRHGDWHLALASYNRGENAIGREVARNRAIGRSTEFSALRLPAETRDYLPKLQALKNIVARPEIFDIELPYVANEQLLAAVDAPIGIDLATAARYAELPLEEFLAYNPGYNRPAITAPGQTLVVPSDRETAFSARLREFERSGKGWRSHTLARGETIGGIANRHGLTPPQLLQINGLHERSLPPLGYSLLVPGKGVNPGDALAVSELLPASARSAARAGVRIAPDPAARKKQAKTAKRGGKKAASGKLKKAPPGKLKKARGGGKPRAGAAAGKAKTTKKSAPARKPRR
ncbi:MAG: transglycosylase SLT domain-containing protein [Azoarcus sp.]|jgi:membrane-bound lytic murein transglycosylase D|nr:transglycosylase SLT domain-containing protein [Azoarcus sp.]